MVALLLSGDPSYTQKSFQLMVKYMIDLYVEKIPAAMEAVVTERFAMITQAEGDCGIMSPYELSGPTKCCAPAGRGSYAGEEYSPLVYLKGADSDEWTGLCTWKFQVGYNYMGSPQHGEICGLDGARSYASAHQIDTMCNCYRKAFVHAGIYKRFDKMITPQVEQWKKLSTLVGSLFCNGTTQSKYYVNGSTCVYSNGSVIH